MLPRGGFWEYALPRVTREEVYRSIRTVGEIDYDEERVATIAAYVDGRLEELFAEYVGVQVAQGRFAGRAL